MISSSLVQLEFKTKTVGFETNSGEEKYLPFMFSSFWAPPCWNISSESKLRRSASHLCNLVFCSLLLTDESIYQWSIARPEYKMSFFAMWSVCVCLVKSPIIRLFSHYKYLGAVLSPQGKMTEQSGRALIIIKMSEHQRKQTVRKWPWLEPQ